jgi:hypothetical protein
MCHLRVRGIEHINPRIMGNLRRREETGEEAGSRIFAILGTKGVAIRRLQPRRSRPGLWGENEKRFSIVFRSIYAELPSKSPFNLR